MTKSIAELVIAVVMTVVLGVGALEAWRSMSFPGAWLAGVMLVAMAVAAGPVFLYRRGWRPIVPIAAIYSVLMIIALLFVAFAMAWRRGTVDL